jgi:DMSO/TMAO reductase YedYZ heme-binding membrane subunit
MIGAIKNLVVTTIAIMVWLLATVVAATLVSVFTGMWYVFFGTPVFGDFLGFFGPAAPATPATTWTLVFVGVMFLLAALACYLIFRKWNNWRRAILRMRRNWLGLA